MMWQSPFLRKLRRYLRGEDGGFHRGWVSSMDSATNASRSNTAPSSIPSGVTKVKSLMRRTTSAPLWEALMMF